MVESINIIGARVDGVSTTNEATLGVVVEQSNGNKLQYCQANGAIAVNEFVIIDEDFQAAKITATAAAAGEGLHAGIAETALADNEYGYITIEGIAKGKVAANCAAHAKLYTTATGGVLDDATSTGYTIIENCVALTAVVTAGVTDIRLGATNIGAATA